MSERKELEKTGAITLRFEGFKSEEEVRRGIHSMFKPDVAEQLSKLDVSREDGVYSVRTCTCSVGDQMHTCPCDETCY